MRCLGAKRTEVLGSCGKSYGSPSPLSSDSSRKSYHISPAQPEMACLTATDHDDAGALPFPQNSGH